MPTTFGGWKAQDYFGKSVSVSFCQLSPTCQCCSATDDNSDNWNRSKGCRATLRQECRPIRAPRLWLFNPETGKHEWKEQKNRGGSHCVPKWETSC